MYREDVARIADYAQTAKGLADTVLFAVLSIRTQFLTMPRQMADVRSKRERSSHLWGWKGQSYRDIFEPGKAERLRDGLNTLPGPVATSDGTLGAMFLLYRSVTGLGMVKSAFVAQMLGYDVACFDARNLGVLGMSPDDAKRAWRLDDVGDGTRIKRMERYIKATRKTGGPEFWWNTWCEGIAPSMGSTPEQVSRLHSKLIIGE